MPLYEWKHVETNEIVTTDTHDTAPDDSGNWRRIYTFGVGSVPGAGGSPARTIKMRNDTGTTE